MQKQDSEIATRMRAVSEQYRGRSGCCAPGGSRLTRICFDVANPSRTCSSILASGVRNGSLQDRHDASARRDRLGHTDAGNEVARARGAKEKPVVLYEPS